MVAQIMPAKACRYLCLLQQSSPRCLETRGDREYTFVVQVLLTPTRVEADYAKWMIEDPRMNFAISTGRQPVGVNHLGFQVDSSGELRAYGEERTGSNGVLNSVPSVRPYNVLFLCTGNSARSILAESLLNHWGKGRFHGYSAGSFPKGQVHPISIALLKQLNLPTEGLRSKSWDEFAAPGSPPLDFIFTVCDNAAGEICPVWPGKPMTAHWGVEDPAVVEGTDAEKWAAFRKALKELERRVTLFISLPVASLDKITLQRRIEAIGTTLPEGPGAS